MTYNQFIKKIQGFADRHKFINTFGTGEEWETEGILKPGIKYQILYAIPVDSTDLVQAKQRRFNFLCFDIVKKDKSNEQEVLSDTEQTLDDLIRWCRNQDDFSLINDPVATPFKESYGDWCAGWGCEVTIESDFNSADCDLPLTGLDPEPPAGYSLIKNKTTGEIVTRLYPGQSYEVIIASGIDSGNSSTTYTIQIVDIN